MPLYEYFCPICNVRFERLRPMQSAERPETCPEGHPNAQRTLSLIAPVGREAAPALPEGGGCACGGACACGA